MKDYKLLETYVLNLIPDFDRLFDKDALMYIYQRYNEPHRYYHNVSHLLHLLNRISLSSRIGNRRILALVALFHDIHYCPVEKNNNEVRSKEVFKDMVDDNY